MHKHTFALISEQVTVLIFIFRFLQIDINDGLSAHLFSLRAVSKQDFGSHILLLSLCFYNKILVCIYHLQKSFGQLFSLLFQLFPS